MMLRRSLAADHFKGGKEFGLDLEFVNGLSNSEAGLCGICSLQALFERA